MHHIYIQIVMHIIPWDGELYSHHIQGRRNQRQQACPRNSLGNPQDLVQKSPLSRWVADLSPTIFEHI
jgi:hypothetical protein